MITVEKPKEKLISGVKSDGLKLNKPEDMVNVTSEDQTEVICTEFDSGSSGGSRKAGKRKKGTEASDKEITFDSMKSHALVDELLKTIAKLNEQIAALET